MNHVLTALLSCLIFGAACFYLGWYLGRLALTHDLMMDETFKDAGHE